MPQSLGSRNRRWCTPLQSRCQSIGSRELSRFGQWSLREKTTTKIKLCMTKVCHRKVSFLVIQSTNGRHQHLFEEPSVKSLRTDAPCWKNIQSWFLHKNFYKGLLWENFLLFSGHHIVTDVKKFSWPTIIKTIYKRVRIGYSSRWMRCYYILAGNDQGIMLHNLP